MRKGLLILMALLLVGTVAVFAGGGGEKGGGAKKTITVGVNSENPPWIFAEDGKMTGYEADILEEFATRAG